MEPIVLIDKTIQPDDVLIFSFIGEKQLFWKQIMQHLHDHYTDITEEWKFYNDGKCWLFRALRKKKTIFWVGVIKGTFRITFYLADKAEPLIEDSSIPEEVKNKFRNAKPSKFGRVVTIIIQDGQDVEVVKTLIALKIKLK
jgi:hypothetical protein